MPKEKMSKLENSGVAPLPAMGLRNAEGEDVRCGRSVELVVASAFVVSVAFFNGVRGAELSYPRPSSSPPRRDDSLMVEEYIVVKCVCVLTSPEECVEMLFLRLMLDKFARVVDVAE